MATYESSWHGWKSCFGGIYRDNKTIRVISEDVFTEPRMKFKFRSRETCNVVEDTRKKKKEKERKATWICIWTYGSFVLLATLVRSFLLFRSFLMDLTNARGRTSKMIRRITVASCVRYTRITCTRCARAFAWFILTFYRGLFLFRSDKCNCQ